jgi:hypothetical protein
MRASFVFRIQSEAGSAHQGPCPPLSLFFLGRPVSLTGICGRLRRPAEVSQPEGAVFDARDRKRRASENTSNGTDQLGHS